MLSGSQPVARPRNDDDCKYNAYLIGTAKYILSLNLIYELYLFGFWTHWLNFTLACFEMYYITALWPDLMFIHSKFVSPPHGTTTLFVWMFTVIVSFLQFASSVPNVYKTREKITYLGFELICYIPFWILL